MSSFRGLSLLFFLFDCVVCHNFEYCIVLSSLLEAMIDPQESTKPLNICIISKQAKTRAEASIDAGVAEVRQMMEHHDIISSPDQDMIDHGDHEIHTGLLSSQNLAYDGVLNTVSPLIEQHR